MRRHLILRSRSTCRSVFCPTISRRPPPLPFRVYRGCRRSLRRSRRATKRNLGRPIQQQRQRNSSPKAAPGEAVEGASAQHEAQVLHRPKRDCHPRGSGDPGAQSAKNCTDIGACYERTCVNKMCLSFTGKLLGPRFRGDDIFEVCFSTTLRLRVHSFPRV